MARFYYVELYKFFRRKEVYWALLIGVIIPIFFGFLTKIGGNVTDLGGLKFSALGYGISMFEFLKVLFFYFVFIIFTSSTFAGELEKGSLSLLLVRSENRTKVILSKFFAVITVLAIFVILIIISGIISYYAFLYNTKFAINEFFARQVEGPHLYGLFLSFFELVFIILCALFLSLYFTNYKTILFSVGLVILMKVLESVDKIKKFIPTHLANIDAITISVKTQQEFSIKFMQNLLLLSLYSLAILILAIYKFSRMDIKS